MEFLLTSLFILIIFLALSAFFSGSETALFSLKQADIHRFSLSSRKVEREISRSMRKPQNILITILIGNLLVNIIVTALTTTILLTIWPKWGHIIALGMVTPLIIVLCEITPKVIAINAAESFSKKVFPFLSFFQKLFLPLQISLILFSNTMMKLFGIRIERKRITEDELGHAVNMGEQQGIIEKEEGALIKNVMRFTKKEAANVMFPRNRAVFLPKNASLEEAMNLFIDSGVIRAPVYEEDLDHVIGFVDSRELIPYHLGFKKTKNITRFIKEIKFFPESRELNDLLNDFLSEGIQLAILLDEYGGTAGVVTLNAILSELMGSGFSKWEVDSYSDIKQVNNNVTIISGHMQLVDFNQHFEEKLESHNADTIGGYIIEQLAHIPKRSEEVATEKNILKVRYIKKNKIESVEVIEISSLKGDI